MFAWAYLDGGTVTPPGSGGSGSAVRLTAFSNSSNDAPPLDVLVVEEANADSR
eukprot:COSAG03_NODE_11496_length_589_cov_1.300000_1_plen_52_part_01